MKGQLSLGGVVVADVTDITLTMNATIEKPDLVEIETALHRFWDPYKVDYDVMRIEHSLETDQFIWETTSPWQRKMKTLVAARVPLALEPQVFGLWGIERRFLNGAAERLAGGPHQTILRRITMATVHLAEDGKASGEIVMEDSVLELCRHLPIWMAARGRVLLTGLGLGCVLRGLLINPLVTHVDVVELDPSILRIVGAEFKDNPRVTLHLGDALKYHWPRGTRWDFAWHDIVGGQEFTGKQHTQVLHGRLFRKYHERADRQGAWAFPRYLRQALKRSPDGHRFL